MRDANVFMFRLTSHTSILGVNAPMYCDMYSFTPCLFCRSWDPCVVDESVMWIN